MEASANQRPGREADDSLLSRAEIRNDEAIPPLLHAPSWRDAELIETRTTLHYLVPDSGTLKYVTAPPFHIILDLSLIVMLPLDVLYT
jgi:hypothetical protein